MVLKKNRNKRGFFKYEYRHAAADKNIKKIRVFSRIITSLIK